MSYYEDQFPYYFSDYEFDYGGRGESIKMLIARDRWCGGTKPAISTMDEPYVLNCMEFLRKKTEMFDEYRIWYMKRFEERLEEIREEYNKIEF